MKEVVLILISLLFLSADSGELLWKFLLELLNDVSYEEIISWTGNKGEFKLNDAEEVSRQWGERKAGRKMSYESMSRSLRSYYDEDILYKTRGVNFVYHFNLDFLASL